MPQVGSIIREYLDRTKHRMSGQGMLILQRCLNVDPNKRPSAEELAEITTPVFVQSKGRRRIPFAWGPHRIPLACAA